MTTDLPIERLTRRSGRAVPAPAALLPRMPIGDYTAALERHDRGRARRARRANRRTQIFPELLQLLRGRRVALLGTRPVAARLVRAPHARSDPGSSTRSPRRKDGSTSRASTRRRGPAGCRARSSRAPRRARNQRLAPANCFTQLTLPLLHLLGREIFLVRRDRPLVPVRIDDSFRSDRPRTDPAILPHRPASACSARRDGAIEQRVAVLHVDPERRRRSADRFGPLAAAPSRRSA